MIYWYEWMIHKTFNWNHWENVIISSVSGVLCRSSNKKIKKIKKQTKYFYEKRIFESDKLCDGCMVIPLVFEDTSCFVELEFKKNPLFFAKNLKKKFSKLLSIFLRNFSSFIEKNVG